MSTGSRETLSVVIPTKDAAPLLRDCLASVSWADEIVVVDMFSTDETPEVCAEHHQCRLFQRNDYIFGNVNFGFEQATSDWILRLDTDERVTPELQAEISGILTAPPTGVTGFEFWERLFVLGHELKHGFGRKHYRKVMFRHGQARYRVEHEHEDLDTAGIWLRGRNGYLHYNYGSVRDYLTKMNYYTDKDVGRATLPEKAPPVAHGPREAIRAFYLYYLKYQGFRDGWIGFVDSAMRGTYQLVSWAKLRERWERERGST
jgi:glycosyltransferase involved in cell wall biosynthesis